jgi:hypothetical protein
VIDVLRAVLISLGVLFSLLAVCVLLSPSRVWGGYGVIYVPGSPVAVCSSNGVEIHIALRNLGPGAVEVSGVWVLGERVPVDIVIQPGDCETISRVINATCPHQSLIPVVVETSVGDITVYAMVYS